jgi:hypothetical protein
MPGKGKPFQKGRSGNPGGRTKSDRELDQMRAMSKEQLKEVLNLTLSYPREQLEQVLAKPDTPWLIEWCIRLTFVSAEKGDIGVFREWMDRLIGKVPDKLDPELAAYLELIKRYKALPREELIKLAHETIETEGREIE